MNTKRMIILTTAGALAIGLTVGGVGTAIAMDSGTPTPAHSHTPAVPSTPTNGGGGHHSTPVNTTVTPQDLWNIIEHQYDKTLYPNARFEPVPGTYAFDLGQAGGQVEQYIGTDGNVFTIGVAKGSFATMQQKIARGATLLPGYDNGVHVYEVNGGGTYTGDYEIFADGYWISVTSNLLTSPQTAAPMIQGVLQALPQG